MAKITAPQINRYERENKILAGLLATENISVSFVPGAATASFDMVGRNMILPVFCADVPVIAVDMFVIHEMGHALYTERDFNSKLEKATGIPQNHPNFGIVHSVFNVFEDNRIDRLNNQKYYHTKRIREQGIAYLHEQRDIFKLGTTRTTIAFDDFGFVDRVNMQSKIGHIVTVEFSPEEKSFFDRINVTKTAAEVYKLVAEYIDMLIKDQDSSGKSGVGESDSESDSSGQVDSDSSGQADSDSSGSGQGKNSKGGKKDKDGNPEGFNHKMNANGEGQEKGSGEGEGSGEGDADEVWIITDEDLSGSGSGQGDSSESDQKGPKTYKISTKPGSNPTGTKSDVKIPDAVMKELQKRKGFQHYDQKEADASPVASNKAGDRGSQLPPKKIVIITEDLSSIIDHGSNLRILNVRSHNWIDKTPSQYNMFYRDLEKDPNRSTVEGIADKQRQVVKPYISHAVSTFLARMRAMEAANTRISKTGNIDPQKIHGYKVNEDLFLSREINPQGKSHGIFVMIDTSGSMQGNNIQILCSQLFALVEFCDRLNIPYEVWTHGSNGFFNGYGYGYNSSRAANKKFEALQNVKGLLKPACEMQCVISSTMKANSKKLIKAWIAATSEKASYTQCPAGTHIAQSLNSLLLHAKKFKETNNLQFLHTVVMTDGEDTGDYSIMEHNPSTNNILSHLESGLYEHVPTKYAHCHLSYAGRLFQSYLKSTVSYIKFSNFDAKIDARTNTSNSNANSCCPFTITQYHNRDAKKVMISPEILQFKGGIYGFDSVFAMSPATITSKNISLNGAQTEQELANLIRKQKDINAKRGMFLNILATAIAEGGYR